MARLRRFPNGNSRRSIRGTRGTRGILRGLLYKTQKSFVAALVDDLYLDLPNTDSTAPTISFVILGR